VRLVTTRARARANIASDWVVRSTKFTLFAPRTVFFDEHGEFASSRPFVASVTKLTEVGKRSLELETYIELVNAEHTKLAVVSATVIPINGRTQEPVAVPTDVDFAPHLSPSSFATLRPAFPSAPPSALRWAFALPLRSSDLDPFLHVNNTVTGALFMDALYGHVPARHRVASGYLEYNSPLLAGDVVTVACAQWPLNARAACTVMRLGVAGNAERNVRAWFVTEAFGALL